MSKLEFKPQDRQSIDFAEQERKKTKEKGQIVRENFNGRLVFEEQNSSSNSVYFAEIDCYSGRFEINRKNKENQTIENIVKIDLTDKKILIKNVDINTFITTPSKSVYSQGTISYTDSQITAPCNGILQVFFNNRSDGAGYITVMNNTRGYQRNQNCSKGDYPQQFIPVIKGDIINFSYNGSYDSIVYKFIKALEV